MENYVIVTDATCDLPSELVETLGITVIPMVFNLSGREYLHYPDGRQLDPHTFYERLRAGEMPTTAQINAATFTEVFTPILQGGQDILYLCFSSGLSGTYQSACIAAEELAEQFPGRRVVCVDSLAASVGEGMLCYYAVQKKLEGMGLDELRDWLVAERDHLCHWFTVDDLGHLKRGGRVSAVTAAVGTALGIKPILHVDDEGHLIPMGKARGRRKSLEALVEHMKQTAVRPEEQVIFIGHGDAPEDAEYVAELVRQAFPVKDIIISYIGPIIGTHSGPGTIALFFWGTQK